MQLHVDQEAGKVAPMGADIYEPLSAIWAVHKKLKKPDELGRVMTVPVKTKPVARAKKKVAKSAARKKRK
jgi:hypothetical protein